MKTISTKKLFLRLMFLVVVAGCATHQPPQPTGSWTPVNKVSASDDAMQVQKSTTPTTLSLSLENAIEQYVPTSFQLTIDSSVDLKTLIIYDSSKNWLEALAQGMSEASIEFVANLYKKSGTIKRTTQTLAEIIDTLLPPEYTVFSDARLNQTALLHFDQRKHWIDELNSSTSDIGIELKIDFAKKIIYLSPTNQYSDFPTSASHN